MSAPCPACGQPHRGARDYCGAGSGVHVFVIVAVSMLIGAVLGCGL